MIHLRTMSILGTLRNRKLTVFMLMIFIALLVQTSWVEEDAFITLRTADNFIHGYGLRWNVIERVQTYTNPLWMFLLTGTHLLIKNPQLTLILLSSLVSTLAVFVFLTTMPQNNFGLLLGFSVLMLSKAFVDYSTSGMENPATHLFLVCFAALYFRVGQSVSEKQWFLLSLLAGLAAFNRMDTLLFYLPALAYILTKQPSRRKFLILLAGLTLFILWEIFAIIYYGFPFPNTYYAKLNTGVPLSESLAQGGLYFINSLGWDPITLTVIFSALGLSLLGKRKEEIVLALGVGLYLAYILYIGGDYMSGRFFSGPLMLSAALLVRRVEDALTLEKYIWVSLVLLIGLILAPLKSYVNPLDSDLSTFDTTSGIADERNGYYRYSNLLLLSRGEGVQPHQFVNYGRQLKEEQIKFVVANGIGMVGYYAGPGTHLIDELGLGDPLLARLPANDPQAWRIAHFVRAIPEGYVLSLENNDNQIADPALAKYYDQLRLITRGRIWSLERWSALWKMNTGQYDYLIEEYMGSQP